MQNKIPYPKDGVIHFKGSRYIVGEGFSFNKKKKAHIHKYFFIPKYERCNSSKGKKEISGYRFPCWMRATFYGYENIGPRVYSVHKCIMGHVNRTRLVQNNGPELTKYLKSK
jgi:hypothetical protein